MPDNNRASGFVEFRQRFDLLHACKLIGVGARDKDVMASWTHCFDNLCHMICSLAGPKNHLRETLPQRAVMVDVGKAQILERQGSETIEGLVFGQRPLLQVPEN